MLINTGKTAFIALNPSVPNTTIAIFTDTSVHEALMDAINLLEKELHKLEVTTHAE